MCNVTCQNCTDRPTDSADLGDPNTVLLAALIIVAFLGLVLLATVLTLLRWKGKLIIYIGGSPPNLYRQDDNNYYTRPQKSQVLTEERKSDTTSKDEVFIGPDCDVGISGVSPQMDTGMSFRLEEIRPCRTKTPTMAQSEVQSASTETTDFLNDLSAMDNLLLADEEGISVYSEISQF